MTAVPQPTPETAAARGPGGPLRLADRRRDRRRLVQTRATLTILDGPEAGMTCEVQVRDLSLSGLSFLLRQPLTVGQLCRVVMPGGAATVSHTCEVVRVRPLSTGKYEMGLVIRRAI